MRKNWNFPIVCVLWVATISSKALFSTAVKENLSLRGVVKISCKYKNIRGENFLYDLSKRMFFRVWQLKCRQQENNNFQQECCVWWVAFFFFFSFLQLMMLEFSMYFFQISFKKYLDVLFIYLIILNMETAIQFHC